MQKGIEVLGVNSSLQEQRNTATIKLPQPSGTLAISQTAAENAFRTIDAAAFQPLKEIYQLWKASTDSLPTTCKLPDLGAYPKDFPRPTGTEFIVRSSVVDIFKELEEFDNNSTKGVGRVTYGLYIAGPFGSGKSVAMYLLTCLAIAHDWLVLYLPRCNEWVSMSQDAEEAARFMLKTMCGSFRSYLKTPLMASPATTKGYQTREDLIHAALLGYETCSFALKEMLEQLQSFTERPCLFVIDEVNAIWKAHKQEQWPFVLFAHFNRITLKRGWKLISGTSHSAFIHHIPDGLQTYVRYFEPYSNSEFDLLMLIDCPPKLQHILAVNNNNNNNNATHSTASLAQQQSSKTPVTSILPASVNNNNANNNNDKLLKANPAQVLTPSPQVQWKYPKFVARIRNSLGNVPWQYAQLGRILNQMTPNPDTITNYQDKLDAILSFYETFAENEFAISNNNYLSNLSKEDLLSHCSVLIDTLVFRNVLPLRLDFLDISLMYFKKAIYRCIPISAAAFRALVANLSTRFNLLLEIDTDVALILNQKYVENSEKTKAFERLFIKYSLLHCSLLECCNFDGSIVETISFTTSYVTAIPNDRMLPAGPVEYPTMFYPVNMLKPVADLIHVHPQQRQITILQLTISNVAAKQPGKNNSYSSLLDPQKWSEISKSHQPKHNTGGRNFAEDLVYSLWGTEVKVTINNDNNNNNNQLAVIEPNLQLNCPAIRIEYLIVSPHELSASVSKELHQTPWVRCMTAPQLHKFMSDEIVNSLVAK